MDKRTVSVFAAGAVIVAIAVPTIVSGNARRIEGSLSDLQAAETPYIAQLKGSSEVPAGDPDGFGAATVSFDRFSDTEAEVCWDLSLADIGTATAAHIHRGAAGANGPIVVDFGTVGPNSDSDCDVITPALADEIRATPGSFYVNVHSSVYPGGAIRGQLAKGPESAGSTHFLPTPLRAYDSRSIPGTKIPAGETRTVSLATGKDNLGASFIAVPPGATGAVVTLTITQTTGNGGFLSLYNAANTAAPLTSSINWTSPDFTVAVTTTVAVDVSGQVKVTAGPQSTHFLIDVIGYLY